MDTLVNVTLFIRGLVRATIVFGCMGVVLYAAWAFS